MAPEVKAMAPEPKAMAPIVKAMAPEPKAMAPIAKAVAPEPKAMADLLKAIADIVKGTMIKVTRLNGKEYYINPHQIEYMETRPDTSLVMLSGKTVVVKEAVDDVIDRIVEYRRRIGAFKNED